MFKITVKYEVSHPYVIKAVNCFQSSNRHVSTYDYKAYVTGVPPLLLKNFPTGTLHVSSILELNSTS
jgi:hypothetical protein